MKLQGSARADRQVKVGQGEEKERLSKEKQICVGDNMCGTSMSSVNMCIPMVLNFKCQRTS